MCFWRKGDADRNSVEIRGLEHLEEVRRDMLEIGINCWCYESEMKITVKWK